MSILAIPKKKNKKKTTKTTQKNDHEKKKFQVSKVSWFDFVEEERKTNVCLLFITIY